MEKISESLCSISLLWLVTVTALLLVFFLLPLCLRKFSKQNFENLPPGPPRLPIIGNLHQLGNLPHLSLYKLSQKYGPVMHLELGQVPALVVSSPEMAKEVLKVHDAKCCSRPDSYGMRKLSYNQKDISFSPYGDYWREMRKLCVIELFTVKRVRSFQHVRDREIAKFVNIISQEALDPNNKFIYLDKKIFSLAKNIISEVAFGSSSVGEKFREDELQKIIQDVMKVTSGFCAADFFPYIGWIIDLLSGFRHKMETCFLDIDKFNESVIKEHLDPSRPRLKHEDITDILIALSNDETGALRLTKDHIKAVFVDLFMASIDTSSGTIVWAMSELAKNPRLPSGMKPEDINMEEEVGLTINKKYPLQLVPIKHKIETE
ncbi:4-hydroxyphenylacetaldehyde oxime monooxygenase [Heracleum sosnowskyi]|uniref:4-hydroxyphenylacetaldehyde oxime monooxygenase n=1 Tax=Heracleum sosnowskyi TaxID=360622 RepID=A0AAD8HQM2_9APIA|nr:4-hydroxyphenylacetaldehyde oxime monooxygenase [Heracleum sosnowskyi]